MAIPFSLTLLLLLLLTTTAQLTPPPSQPPSTAATPPPPSTAHTPPPPSLSTLLTPPSEIQENQLRNIIDALIGAGDFGGWANLLASADSSAFPLTATLFIPNDDAAAHSAAVTTTGISFDPFLIPYHIVPRRLTFADLQQLPLQTRIPTLLPSKSIVITNNSASNFIIDDSQITQADIFSNAAFSVHGINNILDYSEYGGGGALIDSPPPRGSLWAKPSDVLPQQKETPNIPAGITVGVSSDAAEFIANVEENLPLLLIILALNLYLWISMCGAFGFMRERGYI